MRNGTKVSLLLLLVMTGIGGVAAQPPGNQPKASGMEADVAKIKQAMLGNWESIALEVRPSAARNADFLLEVADLPAERRLRGVQLLLGGNGKTAGIGHGDEVAQMPQLHCKLPYPAGMGPAYKVFFSRASRLYSTTAL